MYFRILKKDVKRKKTMNCIILLFVIITAMFFSSGMNNILSIIGGVDRFLDKAGMGDEAIALFEPEGEKRFSEFLDGADNISGYRKDEVIAVSAENILLDGEKAESFSYLGLIQKVNDNGLILYDADNNEFMNIKKGQVFITNSIAKKEGVEIGDTIEFELCGEKYSFEYAGSLKDAVLGSTLMENPRFLISDEDYEMISSNNDIMRDYRFGMYYVDITDDGDAVDLLPEDRSIIFSGFRSMIKMSYILYTIIAGVIMAISIALMIIAFIVLRFTISLTIAEEFREIGVMKAIGLKNISVRGIYLIKYLGISLIGATTGFLASIPFGRMLLDSVSDDMVLSNEHPIIIGLICSAAVIGIMMLFCLFSTAKIKKMSPIDAVRSGQTGERFNKKSVLSLSRSKLGTNSFMSLNDILSAPKQTAVLIVVLTLFTILVMVLSTTANTLAGEELINLLGCTKSDAYIELTKETMMIMGGAKTIKESYSDIEKTLAENNMPGKVRIEVMYNIPVEFEGNSTNIRIFKCDQTKASDYVYTEGSAPKYKNEIALANVMADELGAGIGDKLTLIVNGEKSDYILTALFDSMSSLGKCGRFSEQVSIPDSQLTVSMAYQIDFDDSPGKSVIDERIEKLKDIYDTQNVYNTSGYVDHCTGSSDIINNVKLLTMLVSIVVTILVCVLIEISFISKEKSEIALMKAIGFKTRSVISVHVLKFIIIGAVSVCLAIALSTPATKLLMDPIFGLMGAGKGISYEINAFESFLLIPAVMFASIAASVLLVSFRTSSIKASDVAGIE